MWEKGVKELMEAIVELKQPDIKLLIIGSVNFAEKKKTAYSKEVEKICKKNEEKFIFTGYIDNSELYKYSDIADIQCVPSMREEAAGLVVLEAMAKGLPTIVTKSGGMPEYVTEETTIVVDKGKDVVSHLAEAILMLKEDKEKRKRMGEAAKEHVKKYSEEQYYEKFCNIVMNIIEDEGGKEDESRNINIS